MGITLLTTKQLMDFGKNAKPEAKKTLEQFLKDIYNCDLDGEGCAGWRFKGKETTDYETAKTWYNG